MTKEHKQLKQAIGDLRSIKDAGSIRHPHRCYFIAYLNGDVAHMIKAEQRGVFISRRSIKHILERRGSNAEAVFGELKGVIEKPTKIVDNSSKRKDSFIFIRSAEITVAAIIEITEKPGSCQVVSAFLMDQKTYEKQIDISGRAEFPPFELSS